MQLTSLFAPLLLALLHLLPGPSARTPRYSAGDTLAPYVGTWVGRTSTGEFKLVMEERKQFHVGDVNVGDIIAGRHSYVTPNGPVNESLSLPANKSTLTCFADEKNPGELYGIFQDEVNRKRVDIRLSFADAAKTQLSWFIVRERETWSFDPAKPILTGVSVPTYVVLTRVN